jgi:two-component system, OmpR family, phosphate regulon sensor histidine kinase PhoR
MSVSLIGIIGVQLYWVSNAVAVREAQFDVQVNKAMHEVVDRLETREQMIFISRHFGNAIKEDTVVVPHHSKFFFTTPGFVQVHDTLLHENKELIKEMKVVLNHEEVLAEEKAESLKSKNKSIIKFKSPTDQVEKSGVFHAQLDTLELVEKVEWQLDKRKDIMEKILIEKTIIDRPLEFRLKVKDLRHFIAQSLQQRDLRLPFEYAVIDQNTALPHNAFVSEGFEASADSKYRLILYPHDLLIKDYWLVLQFPEKGRFLIGSMWLMLLASVFFTFIIVLTFGATLYFMIRQKKISEIKTDFINNMTHEFKTPIATISLALDALKHPQIRADQQQSEQYAKIIGEENQRMNQQVEKVLQMAMLEKQELELNFESCSAHQLIEQAARKMKLLLEARGAVLELDFQAKYDQVRVDSLHLHNVILNLIDNALKYSTGFPNVIIRTVNSANGLAISVSDMGIGMSREVLKNVFVKFYRAQRGNLHTVKGFGLGLRYVKAIVEAHGGHIEIQSQPKEGTTVTIWLETSN